MKAKEETTNAELRSEYDFDYSKAIRGKYCRRILEEGANVVMLEPDVAKVFKVLLNPIDELRLYALALDRRDSHALRGGRFNHKDTKTQRRSSFPASCLCAFVVKALAVIRPPSCRRGIQVESPKSKVNMRGLVAHYLRLLRGSSCPSWINSSLGSLSYSSWCPRSCWPHPSSWTFL